MSEISQLAKDWIDRAAAGDGVSGTWRLEILQKRLRANPDGTPKDGKEIPIRIRRFLKGIPWAQVHDAIRYLISKSPYEDVIYNGLRLEGKYRPTLTQWRRDDQEQVGGNAQGSYTLVQDLIEVTDETDSFDGATSDSCSETVETKWVWDSPEIEELPYSSEQGVTYAIQQVRRNDDGTFDYAVVKRVAKTQVSDETVVQCDEYETVYATVYDNVYGGEGGEPFRDDAGNPVALPQPCEDREAGTLIQVQKSQNQDCTFRITVQRTVAKEKVQATEVSKTLRGVQTTTVTRNNDEKVPETGLGIGDRVRNELQPDGLYTTTETRKSAEDVGDTGSGCEKTIFEHQHTAISNVSERPGDEASEAGGGKTYEKTVRATDEGTFDVTERTTTEQYVGSARVVRAKGLRGITVSTTDRNTTNSSTAVSNVGDRVEVEATPGGLFNRTVTTVSKTSVGSIGDECAKTVFEHSHTGMSNVATKPGAEASSAGGGKTYRKTVRMTEEGTFDVSEEETTELNPGIARHSMRKTLRGVTETQVYRNVKDDSVAVAKVGDETVVERTPGGLFVRTITRASSQSAGDIASDCQTTVFEHQDSKTVNSSSATVGGHAPSAGGGKTYERTVRMTEEGSFDVTDRTTVETSVPGAVVVRRKTIRGVTETVTNRNGTDGNATVSSIGDETRVEVTPGGRYNKTTTRVLADPVGEIARGCSRVTAEHTDTVTENKTVAPTEHVEVSTNRRKSVESRMTEEGTFDVTTVDTEYSPVSAGPTRVQNGGTTHPIESVSDWSGRNWTSGPPSSSGGTNHDVSVNVSANDHGSQEISVRETVYRHVTEYSGTSMASAVSASWGDKEEFYHVANAPSPPREVRASSGEAIRMQASLNGHGSLDVSWQKRTAEPYLTWEAEVDTGYDYTRTVWFKHATRNDYKSLFDKEAKSFKDKCKKWCDSYHAPQSTSVSPQVNDEEYVERFSGTITMRATWSGESVGNVGDSEKPEIVNVWFDCDNEGARHAGVNKDGDVKYYASKNDYHFVKRVGRGWKSFHQVYNTLMTGKRGQPHVSVDINPNTLVWTIQLTWADNFRTVEYNDPN